MQLRNLTFSESIKQSNTDEWYTPREAVEIIIPFLTSNKYQRILCPFDDESSNFVKTLKDFGFHVTYSHINTGTDFFNIDNLNQFDAVVSNPPFSKRQKILEKLFSSNVPFAMIFNFNGLFDNKKRWELFKKNKFELLVPCGRIKFYNENCDGKSPMFQSVYVCHNVLPDQIVFAGGDV